MNTLAKNLRKSPNDNEIRENIFLVKKTFQAAIKKMKTAYKLSIIEKMNLSSKQSPQKFWKLLDKIAPNSKTKYINHNNISISKWVDHFKSILNSKRNVELPPDDNNIGPLDYKITIEELTLATALLKTGKSPGLDNITNEMIICTLQYYPNIFLSLFNNILEKGGSIPSWSL